MLQSIEALTRAGKCRDFVASALHYGGQRGAAVFLRFNGDYLFSNIFHELARPSRISVEIAHEYRRECCARRKPKLPIETAGSCIVHFSCPRHNKWVSDALI